MKARSGPKLSLLNSFRICRSDCLSVMRPWLRIRYPETLRRTGSKRSEWQPSAANLQI